VADQLSVSKIADTGTSDQSASKNHKLHLIHSQFHTRRVKAYTMHCIVMQCGAIFWICRTLIICVSYSAFCATYMPTPV